MDDLQHAYGGTLYGNHPGNYSPQDPQYTETGQSRVEPLLAQASIINARNRNNDRFHHPPLLIDGALNLQNCSYDRTTYTLFPPPLATVDKNEEASVLLAAIKSVRRTNTDYNNKILALTGHFKQNVLLN